MFSNTVYFHSMVLLFLMTQAIAPEHDDQKNYPLFNRLGTAASATMDRRASLRTYVYIQYNAI